MLSELVQLSCTTIFRESVLLHEQHSMLWCELVHKCPVDSGVDVNRR